VNILSRESSELLLDDREGLSLKMFNSLQFLFNLINAAVVVLSVVLYQQFCFEMVFMFDGNCFAEVSEMGMGLLPFLSGNVRLCLFLEHSHMEFCCFEPLGLFSHPCNSDIPSFHGD